MGAFWEINKKCSILGATVPLFDAKDKLLPVIFVHMTPQSIATWNKLLAILTIVSRWYVLAFDVFIQMSPIDGWVVTVCTYPRSIRFQYFGLDQLVNILFRCKNRTLLNKHIVCVLKSFGLWMISPNMRSEGISWWTEFLTILTVVAWGHVLGLHVLIKMRLGCGEVATVSAGPGAVHFGHFWLNQSLKISCNILSCTGDALGS